VTHPPPSFDKLRMRFAGARPNVTEGGCRGVSDAPAGPERGDPPLRPNPLRCFVGTSHRETGESTTGWEEESRFLRYLNGLRILRASHK
jgi:hypothetical protein